MPEAKPESGLRNHRTEFAESDYDNNGIPQPASNPTWNRISDRVYSINWAPSANLEGDRGIGDADVDDFDKAPEEHEITVTYALQQWFTDGASNPQDFAGYGMLRDADQMLPSSLTFVDREDKSSINANSTINGSNSLDTRIYTVAVGAKVSELSVIVDPTSQQPVQVEAVLMAEYARRHQIDQPGSSTQLDVSSSSSDDDSQTLVIEDEGANNTENVSLSGTSTVTTSTSFADIDAIYVTDGSGNPSETVGDVTVSDGSNDLAVIQGSSSYENVEGDMGVPSLGNGNHASAIGSDYYRTLTDTITVGGSSTYFFEINSKELTIDNNVEPRARSSSYRQRLEDGARDTELAATVYGETQSYADIERSLTNAGADIVWTFTHPDGTSDTITLNTAKLVDPGEVTHEAEETQMTLDNTFSPQGGGTSGLTVS